MTTSNEPLQAHASINLDVNETELEKDIVLSTKLNRNQILGLANSLVIESDFELNEATNFLTRIKIGIDRIEEYFKERIGYVNQLKAVLLGDKAKLVNPLSQAETITKEKILEYRAARRKAQEEEELKLRLEAQAAEKKRLQEQADQLRAQGEADAASQVEMEAEFVPPPAISIPRAPEPAGQSERTTWLAELTNISQLIHFVAAHPEYLNLLSFNQTAGNALARSMKNSMNIPGLRAVPKTTLAQSTKR